MILRVDARGVAGGEGDEGGLEPSTLEAVTVKVYPVPSLNPSTTSDVAGDVNV